MPLEFLVVIAVVFAGLLIIVPSTIKIVQEYERGVIFRLGRLVGARGPAFIDHALDGAHHA